jgi:hypothetical protein
MKLTKQILLAFFIPMSLAIGLIMLEKYFFPPVCSSSFVNQGKTFCLEYHDESLVETGYGLLIIGLIIFSFVLPFLVKMRTYQSGLKKLEAPSIIE